MWSIYSNLHKTESQSTVQITPPFYDTSLWFCLYVYFTNMLNPPGYIPVFHQLRLSMEHHDRVSINAPPHSEACFWRELKCSYSQQDAAKTMRGTQVFTVLPLGYPLSPLPFLWEHITLWWEWYVIMWQVIFTLNSRHICTSYMKQNWHNHSGQSVQMLPSVLLCKGDCHSVS